MAHSDEDRHVTEAELGMVASKIDDAVREVKKEVRWLLVLGIAGSQLIHNISIPSGLTATIAGVAIVGKVASSFFFAR